MTEDAAPLAGKVALVTGASRGIGKGIALELGAAGATVYVTGRTRSDSETPEWAESVEQASTIDDTAAELTELGGKGIPAPCDHGNDDEVRALFARVEADQGRLDRVAARVGSDAG